jgi:hypothetical protein
MTLKDELMGQIFKAVMYRKIMLFDDLSVNNDGKEGEEIYASPKVVEINNQILDYVERFRYKPPRLIYEPVTVSKSGVYTQPAQAAQEYRQDTCETMKDMIGEILEME